MRLRPLLWFSISAVCFLAAVVFWRLGDQWAANRAPATATTPPPAAPAAAHAARPVVNGPFALLTQPGSLNAPATPAATNAAPRKNYRVSNTTRTVGELGRSDKAILLENALLDTTQPMTQSIPDHLRAKGDPGSYIVQARNGINSGFRAQLEAAGAVVVCYIPNNAYLVRASASAVASLSAQPGLVQTAVPFEPEYKLKGSLLSLAVEQTPLPSQAALNVLLFPDAQAATVAQLQQLGAQVISQERSPFGTVVRVRPPADSLAALAGLPGVQEIEFVHTRTPANDLSRPLDGVATDSLVLTNYLGLTGTNILININDSGVDTNHPDLAGRVFSDSPLSATDTNGHGTHVAGIIIGDGSQSSTVTNLQGAQGSILPATNNQFRGMAPMAKLFSMLTDPLFGPSYADNFSFGPSYSDSYLQETAALTNAFISNNSWNYSDQAFRSVVGTYDLAAASYDAAVRDALPLVSGAQPLLYVFSAGDGGQGMDDGTGGTADSIQSPATAKNVITVGAYESLRKITNIITVITTNVFTGDLMTNVSQPWMTESDDHTEVAAFSSRGNVGIGLEGDFGRFKPDLTAPGTFIISTRSTEWDAQSYYGFHLRQHPTDVLLAPNQSFVGAVDLPDTTTAINIELVHRRPADPYPLLHQTNSLPSPDMPIFVSSQGAPMPTYDYLGTNLLTILNPPATGTNYIYTVVNTSTQTVLLDIGVDLTYTVADDNTFQVLSNLNEAVGSQYRYESGTSMSAAQVSGILALIVEFLESPAHLPSPRTNTWGGLYGHSPALLKAMLINGARSMGHSYNFQVQNNINFQGWGKVSLPSSLHPGLANEAAPTNSMFLVDQDPTNALATGDSHTYKISVAPEAIGQPLKITLVWSDPPGNPVAGVKLVNDLDLLATNLDSIGTSLELDYFGNDITGINDYNLPWDTNTVPNIDYVNNVENIFIPPPLGTNYSITVVGHRVNVNAVNQSTNIVQDYALVVSCGDGTLTNALTFTRTAQTSVNVPNLTTLTNSFVGSDSYYGQAIANQRVGANSPLVGTNTFTIPTAANALVTLGITNQWHFYVISNGSSFTNARFLLANPLELSTPRLGVDSLFLSNSTRVEADIDMYVSRDTNLLLLDPLVVSNAYKLIGRDGSGAIILSNATSGFYYIGVKSEDQMAAQYTLQVLFSLNPFSGNDALGGHLPWNQWLAIPDGDPQHPGITNAMLGPNMDPTMLVRRVIVTNVITHDLMGDLAGVLSYPGNLFCVLNNHAPQTAVLNERIIYDDSNEGNVFDPVTGAPARHTDGPGSLHNFAGQHLNSIFTFYEEDNALNHIGEFLPLGIFLERQPPLILGVTNTILAGHCSDDYIEVGPQVTSMTIYAALLSGTGPISLEVCTLAGACSPVVTNSPSISITLDQYSNPPLTPTTYDVTACNLGPDTAKVYIIAFLTYGPTQVKSLSYTTNPLTAIPDDAVSYTVLNVTNHATIQAIDVGLLLTNLSRVSDLAITLISPSGQRVLLFENRGAYTTNGLGTFSAQPGGAVSPGFLTYVLTPFYTNNFNTVPVGTYAPGATFDRWSVLTNYATIYPTLPAPWLSNNIFVLGNSVVSNALPCTNASALPLPQTNSTIYQLSFRVNHAPYLAGLLAWWPFDGDTADVFGGFAGLPYGNVGWNTTTGMVNQAYFGDGVATRMVVPRAPALDVGPRPYGFSIQGWVRPDNVTNPAPLVEYYDPTNPVPVGFRFWIGDLSSTNPAPGALSAAFYDTNNLPYYISLTNNLYSPLTNSGWQHVAVTYDPASGQSVLYTNGHRAIAQFLPLTNGLSPRAVGDLYFGFDPPPVPTFAYQDFSSTNGLSLTGSAAQLTNHVLRLTPATNNQMGAVWYAQKQYCAQGFTASFQFQMSNLGGLPFLTPGGDGISFAIQTGSTNATGSEYGAETNGVATGLGVSLNTFWNVGLEPSGNFVGVCTNGGHWIVQRDLNGTAINLKDGQPHLVEIDCDGTFMNVMIDNLLAISKFPVPLTNHLDAQGYAWVGFGGRTGGTWENQDLLSWSFNANGPNPGTAYSGGLDEFTLFDRALTDGEVLAIYQAGTNGMYGTNVSWCPLTNTPAGSSMSVQVLSTLGTTTYMFTNGLAWTNGPAWETNTLWFTNQVLLASTNGPITNITPLVFTNCDPNVVVDDFVLSAVLTNYYGGLMHFTEDTNLALLPIKFAQYPYIISNFPPTVVFTNDFENAKPGVYADGSGILGTTNVPGVPLYWTNSGGPVTVISNALMAASGTNCAVLGMNTLTCQVPTTPGQLYVLTYSVRGPGAVSWWTGDVNPLDNRAWDLLGGNDAAFVYDAGTIADARVGTNSLRLPGVVDPKTQLVSKLEVGDPANLRFTNAFTMEAWVKPYVRTNFVAETPEQILFRGDGRDCMFPYYFALERVTDTDMDILVHIQDGRLGDCGVTLETAYQPVTAGEWQHVAVVFESNVPWTNSAPWPTNELRIYFNGKQLLPGNQDVYLEDPQSTNGLTYTEYTSRFPLRDLEAAYSPGVSIGAHDRSSFAEPFSGEINGLTVYGRALSDEEIREIYGRGAAGKADLTVAPGSSLAKLSVSIDGVQRDVVYGENSQWTTHTLQFAAPSTNSVLVLQGMLPGTIIDGISLTTLPDELNYLPEQTLSSLFGQDAYGLWTLEILDRRTGPDALATNLLAQLTTWQLSFQTFPTVVQPTIALEHGIPYTNSLPVNGYQNFIVQVPQWATNATNVLLYSRDRAGINPLPVGVLCDTNTFPQSFTNALFWPPVNATATDILTTNVAGLPGNPGPVLYPGQSYFLTVTNTNAVAITFAVGVWFDIVTLTNCEPLTNGVVGPAGIPRYYQFDVATNLDSAAGLGQAGFVQSVCFYLSGVESNYTGFRSNLTVVLSEHLPLPDLTHYDYISYYDGSPSAPRGDSVPGLTHYQYLSFPPRTNDDAIMIVSNTTPFALQTNRWYVGIFNAAPTNVPFAVQACYTTNYPTIITLTNGSNYIVSSALNLNTNFVAPPGPPEWFFFRCQITNYVDGVLFELFDLTGAADLVLQRDVPPTMAPYFAASTQPGARSEQIVVRTSGAVPDLRGDWYLGVYSHEATNNLEYTLRASLPDGGPLLSYLPIVITNQVFQTNSLILSWNAVVGDWYTISFNNGFTVNAWTNILATTPVATALVPMPTNGTYVITPAVTPATLRPPLYIAVAPANRLRISWPLGFTGFTLQSSPSLTPPVWSNVNVPVTVEGNFWVVYVPLPTGVTFYRLLQ